VSAPEENRTTRDVLVDLAAELFAKRGYAETSLRDITRRGAMTTGAIYGNFRNKADLLAEAINVRMQQELEGQAFNTDVELHYIETLTRLAAEFPQRSRLRALIVQGAAAAQTDDDTRARLQTEQRAHIDGWHEALEAEREKMGIHPSVDVLDALLYLWAAEVGLGILESMGLEPSSPSGWADMQNRFARSLQLPPDEAGGHHDR
jgi:AcrR family transcriptional regulator